MWMKTLLSTLLILLQTLTLRLLMNPLAYSLCCSRVCALRAKAALSTGYEPRALSLHFTKFSRPSSPCSLPCKFRNLLAIFARPIAL